MATIFTKFFLFFEKHSDTKYLRNSTLWFCRLRRDREDWNEGCGPRTRDRGPSSLYNGPWTIEQGHWNQDGTEN